MDSEDQESERRLLRAARSDDKQAFDALVRRYRQKLLCEHAEWQSSVTKYDYQRATCMQCIAHSNLFFLVGRILNRVKAVLVVDG